MRENEPRGKLVGKIILADFLEYPLERFLSFITKLEELPLYKELSREGIITCRNLPRAKVLKGESIPLSVIAQVKNDGCFSIHYSNVRFSIEYVIDGEKLLRVTIGKKITKEDKEDIGRLLHKLRRISTRNRITHEILEGILNHQRDYLESNDELALKPLRRTELMRAISKKNNSGITVDSSRISRLIRGISVITIQGKEIALTTLFPTRRDTMKRRIRELFTDEREDMCDGRLKVPYTDEQIRCKLSDEHNLSVTRREIAYCRRELGVLPRSKRINSPGYPPLSANFSTICHFTVTQVKNSAPRCPGVYELRLNNAKVNYPKASCEVFYIGSGRNLRKRMLSHLSSSGGNSGIKEFINEKGCAFRYVQLPRGWEKEEKRFYDLFIDTFGDSPVCNLVSPKVSGE